MEASVHVCNCNCRWFDSRRLHVKVSLGKILNPKLLLMCWLGPCMAATTISICLNNCELIWTKASAKCECKYT